MQLILKYNDTCSAFVYSEKRTEVQKKNRNYITSSSR